MIGHVYLGQLNPKEQMTWELGYIFNPKYHRKGFASKASRAIVEYAFKTLKHIGLWQDVTQRIRLHGSCWKELDSKGKVTSKSSIFSEKMRMVIRCGMIPMSMH